jgi:hypothetical protein
MTEFFSNEEKKFIFIHIPKTGGTSVKKILSDKVNIDGFKVNGELVEYNKNTHIGINKEQFKKYKDYYKFVFVRHPYGWIKSYYNFHSNKSKFYKNITTKKIKNTINKSFDEWLEGLKEFNQTDFFTNGDDYLVDKVCRLEKFDEDLKYVLEKININSDFQNIKMKDSKKFNIDTIKNLNDNQKKMIQKICAKDFKLLGYTY